MSHRMKTFLLAATLLSAIAIGAGSAHARPVWVLILDGEAAFPLSGPTGFTEKYESPSLGGGGGLGVIIAPQITVFGRFGYTKLGVDPENFVKEEDLPEDTIVDGGDLDMLYISAGARYYPLRNPPPRVKPYVLASVGWFRVASDTLIASSPILGTEIDNGGSESTVGLSIGVGSDFPITPTVSAFFEAEYQTGFTTGASTATLPVRVGFVFILSRIE
jgi:opacity protein-like surface antigen